MSRRVRTIQITRRENYGKDRLSTRNVEVREHSMNRRVQRAQLMADPNRSRHVQRASSLRDVERGGSPVLRRTGSSDVIREVSMDQAQATLLSEWFEDRVGVDDPAKLQQAQHALLRVWKEVESSPMFSSSPGLESRLDPADSLATLGPGVREVQRQLAESLELLLSHKLYAAQQAVMEALDTVTTFKISKRLEVESRVQLADVRLKQAESVSDKRIRDLMTIEALGSLYRAVGICKQEIGDDSDSDVPVPPPSPSSSNRLYFFQWAMQNVRAKMSVVENKLEQEWRVETSQGAPGLDYLKEVWVLMSLGFDRSADERKKKYAPSSTSDDKDARLETLVLDNYRLFEFVGAQWVCQGLAKCMGRLVHHLTVKGSDSTAAAAYELLLALYQRAEVDLDQHHRAWLMVQLGALKVRLGSLREATDTLQRAVELYQILHEQKFSGEVARALYELAVAHLYLAAGSSSLLPRVAAAVRTRLHKDFFQDQLASYLDPSRVTDDTPVITQTASLSHVLELLQEAGAELKQARASGVNVSPELDSLIMARSGDCYFLQGDLRSALKVYEEAFTTLQRERGASSSAELALVSLLLGVTHFLLRGSPPTAASVLQVSAHTQQRLTLLTSVKRVRLRLAFTYSMLAIVWFSVKSYSKSLSAGRKALDIYCEIYGEELTTLSEDHFWVVTQTVYILGHSLYGLALYDQALPYVTLTQRILESVSRRDVQLCVLTFQLMGDTYQALGKLDEAQEWYTQALETSQHGELTAMDEEEGEEALQSAMQTQMLSRMAEVKITSKDYGGAAQLMEQARNMGRTSADQMQSDMVATLHQLGQIYTLAGELEKAAQSYQECFDMCMEVHGELIPEMSATLTNLAVVQHMRALKTRAKQFRLELLVAAELAHRNALRCEVTGNDLVEYALFLYSEEQFVECADLCLQCLEAQFPASEILLTEVHLPIVPGGLSMAVESCGEMSLPTDALAACLVVACFKRLSLLSDATEYLVSLYQRALKGESVSVVLLAAEALCEAGLFWEAAELLAWIDGAEDSPSDVWERAALLGAVGVRQVLDSLLWRVLDVWRQHYGPLTPTSSLGDLSHRRWSSVKRLHKPLPELEPVLSAIPPRLVNGVPMSSRRVARDVTTTSADVTEEEEVMERIETTTDEAESSVTWEDLQVEEEVTQLQPEGPVFTTSSQAAPQLSWSFSTPDVEQTEVAMAEDKQEVTDTWTTEETVVVAEEKQEDEEVVFETWTEEHTVPTERMEYVEEKEEESSLRNLVSSSWERKEEVQEQEEEVEVVLEEWTEESKVDEDEVVFETWTEEHSVPTTTTTWTEEDTVPTTTTTTSYGERFESEIEVEDVPQQEDDEEVVFETWTEETTVPRDYQEKMVTDELEVEKLGGDDEEVVFETWTEETPVTTYIEVADDRRGYNKGVGGDIDSFTVTYSSISSGDGRRTSQDIRETNYNENKGSSSDLQGSSYTSGSNQQGSSAKLRESGYEEWTSSSYSVDKLGGSLDRISGEDRESGIGSPGPSGGAEEEEWVTEEWEETTTVPVDTPQSYSYSSYR